MPSSGVPALRKSRREGQPCVVTVGATNRGWASPPLTPTGEVSWCHRLWCPLFEKREVWAAWWDFVTEVTATCSFPLNLACRLPTLGFEVGTRGNVLYTEVRLFSFGATIRGVACRPRIFV